MTPIKNVSDNLLNRSRALNDSTEEEPERWHTCSTNQSINQSFSTAEANTPSLQDCNCYLDGGTQTHIAISLHSCIAQPKGVFDMKASYASAADSSLPANNSVQIHRNSMPQKFAPRFQKGTQKQITLKSRLLLPHDVLTTVQLKIQDFGDVTLCL